MTATMQIEETPQFNDELAPGTTLLNGSYEITRFLNSGGFGLTYLAKDSLGRTVVIKECFSSTFCNRNKSQVRARSRAHQADFKFIVSRFVEEARSVAKLKHPNIVGVHQVFEENDTAYMALDYVEGEDLLDIIEDPARTFDPKQIETMLAKLLSAIASVHDKDILHRDISPDNILISNDLEPVLIDFGAAREEVKKSSRVLSSLRVVKDGYSPQEFYVQGSKQGNYSDIYALGASFYHLISGECPPDSPNRIASVAAGDFDPYKPLAGRFEGYDPNFLAAIDKSMNVFPKDRQQSAHDWLAMFDKTAAAVAIEPKTDGKGKTKRVSTKPVTRVTTPEPAPEKPKSKTGLILVTTALVAGIGGVVGMSMMNGSSDPAPSIATPEVDASAPATQTASTSQPGAADAPKTPVQTLSEAPKPVATTPAPSASQTTNLADGTPFVGTEVAPVSLVRPSNLDINHRIPNLSDADPRVASPISGNPPVAEKSQVAFNGPPPQSISFDTNLTQSVIPQPRPGKSDDDLLGPIETALPVADTPAADAPVTSQALQTAATPEVAPEPAPVETPAVSNSTILTGWTVNLPFLRDGSNSLLISKAVSFGDVDLKSGDKLVTINGIPTSSRLDVTEEISKSFDLENSTVVTANIGFLTDGKVVEEDVELNVERLFVLLNGTQFAATFNGSSWETVVTSTPNTDPSQLLTGDFVTAELSTNLALDQSDSIEQILLSGSEDSTTYHSFAVIRDGSTWVAGFKYTNTAN